MIGSHQLRSQSLTLTFIPFHSLRNIHNVVLIFAGLTSCLIPVFFLGVIELVMQFNKPVKNPSCF